MQPVPTAVQQRQFGNNLEAKKRERGTIARPSSLRRRTEERGHAGGRSHERKRARARTPPGPPRRRRALPTAAVSECARAPIAVREGGRAVDVRSFSCFVSVAALEDVKERIGVGQEEEEEGRVRQAPEGRVGASRRPSVARSVLALPANSIFFPTKSAEAKTEGRKATSNCLGDGRTPDDGRCICG